jgi:hypothetical protein
MKKPALVAGCLSALAMLQGQTGEYQITRTFVSPSDLVTAAVAARPRVSSQVTPPIYALGAATNGSFVPFRKLPPSLYRREYHGTAWFEDVKPRWIDDRFLVFDDEAGVAVADVPNRQMLLDHVFEAYAKSPVSDEWAAIRFRPAARMQERLDEDFQDTLLLIDPQCAAIHLRDVTEANFVGHLKGVQPGGVILAKPEWSSDGSGSAVLIWNRGKVEAVRYDTNLNETGRTAVNLRVDRESALSLSLNPNLAEAAKRILSDPTIFH